MNVAFLDDPIGRAKTALRLGLAAAAVLLLAACAGATSARADSIKVNRDTDSSGDPALYNSYLNSNGRIKITDAGAPTPVFWIAVNDLATGEELRVRSDLQISKCTDSDFSQHDSGCWDSPEYNYAPTVKARIILADASTSDPNVPKTSGKTISPNSNVICTTARHHCVPTNFDNYTVTSGDVGYDYVAVILEASGASYNNCNTSARNPLVCDVMDLEGGHGRLNLVRKVGTPGGTTNSNSDRPANPVLKIATTDQEKDDFRKVVYSQQINNPGPLEIRADLNINSNLGYPTPPLIASEILLTSGPGDLTGETIDPRNGENCDGNCSFAKPGTLPCLTSANIANGKKYINVVAYAARSASYAHNTDTVSIQNTGSISVRRWDSSYSTQC